MMKHNHELRQFNWVYALAIGVILCLPILVLPPIFFPADWGKTIIFRSILALLSIFFLFQIFFSRRELILPEFKKNLIAWALGGLATIFLLASIFSVDPSFSFWGNPLRSGGFINFAFYIFFAFAAYVIVKKEYWPVIWKFSIGVGAIVSLVALIQYFSLFKTIFSAATSRPSSTLGNPILLAIYLLLLTFLALGFFVQEKKLLHKAIYGASVALFLVTILVTGSRAAYLGFIFGLIYFLLFYPKKLQGLKTGIAIVLILVIGAVAYMNTQSHLLPFLEKNRAFQQIQQRLSISSFLTDARFPAWVIGYSAFTEKPISGWGPENYSVAFDKHFNSSVGSEETRWWDRAHNVYLEIATTAGLPALIIYLALFALIIWYLQKMLWNKAPDHHDQLWAHVICATLIAYTIANIFSFDSFSSYMMFFLIVAYAMRLVFQQNREIALSRSTASVGKIVAIGLAVIALGFLWQYNIVPFYVNSRINTAEAYINGKNCTDGLQTIENTLPMHSFLDSYMRLKYAEFTKTCSDLYPQNKTGYIQRGMQLINEAAKIQPTYTRYWIYLGAGSDILAESETDPVVKQKLINQSEYYLQQALKLAPKHPEILIELANREVLTQNYPKMNEYAQACVTSNPELGDCYWELALSQMYLGNQTAAKQSIETAHSKGFNEDLPQSLGQLANTYWFLKDYKGLISTYERLIAISPTVPQYHSSLAFFYKEVGDYAKARYEAKRVLELSPESKPNVEAFLRTLPQ
jgi:O-antigen ligase/Tfp pilus assembly protein PilF